MKPRDTRMAEGEFVHVYSRGVRRSDIFHDQRDFARFLFLILHFQGEYYPTNISYAVSEYLKTDRFRITFDSIQKIISTRYVDLVEFTIMDNHLHLIIYERKEGGTSKFMQRVLSAYAKYYNEKYKQSGHLFQGRFGRVHINDNNQFLHLSAYIHRNQHEIPKWKGKEDKYPWSSLQDYVEVNRWPNLLAINHILKQFDNPEDYRHFVNTSPKLLSPIY